LEVEDELRIILKGLHLSSPLAPGNISYIATTFSPKTLRVLQGLPLL
jgi:hypothetical protein